MRTPIRYAALLLAITAPALAAQEPARPKHDSHAQTAKPALDAELAEHFKGIPLTDDQVKHITDIKARHHKAMDAVRKAAKDPNDEPTKVALKHHMDAEHAEFKALLAPEHAKLLEANMKSHHKADAAMDHGGMKHDKAAAPRKPQ